MGLNEEELDVSVVTSDVNVINVVLDNAEVVAATDCVEKGYGSSEVVRLVSQQFVPPSPCPAAPAQHQLLPLDSQRLTSVKPSNWP